MYKHMGKVVIKILQGSAVTQTALGGLTIYLLVANFLCICAKNYENWLAVDKVIAKIIWPRFFGPPCISNIKTQIQPVDTNTYHVIDDYTGAGRKNQTVNICSQPEHVGQNIRGGFHGVFIEKDAVQKKDGVDNVADKPGNITKPHKLIHLTDCTT